MRQRFGHWASERLVLCGVVLGVSTFAFGKVSIQKSATGTTYSVTVDGVAWQDVKIAGQNFVRPELQGVEGYEGVLYQEGAPAVPAIRFFVDGDVSVEAAQPSDNKIFSARLLAPIQPSAAKIQGAVAPFRMNEAMYKSSELYPSQPYDVSPAGSVRGVKRSLVSLYPLAYNALTKEFQFRGAFTVQVSKSSSPKEAGRDVFAFVVGQAFANSSAVAKYAASKRDLGFDVRFIRVGSDANTPDEIRAKLQELYRSTSGGLKYALVIGDAENVPAKASTVISGITDHYYRAIDTDNYSTDVNGPDIGVGRISVKTEDQLSIVVEKYLKYQAGSFASEGWLNKVAFLATDDRYEVAEGTHNYAIQTYTKAKGYLGQFPQADMAGGDQLYAITNHASTANVMASLQDGRTIVDYSGHGANTFWAGPHIDQANVRSIQNDSMPFVISNACITGDFRVDESFAETWQRSATGAVMFWGSMDSSYWDEDDILERRMFDGIYRDHLATFQDITTFAMNELWKQYGGQGKSVYYWETYHTFGDPSMMLRTQATKGVNIEGAEVLPLGINQASFTVTDTNGQPVAGARVGLAKEDGTFAAGGKTDGNGVVNFNITGVSADVANFKVTVYGSNLKLGSKQLQLVAANQPYLALSGFTANGGSTAAVHVGETLNLSFDVKNLGLLGTTGANIQAVLREGPATLVDSTASVPALAPNTSAAITRGDISLQVSPTADSGARIVVDLVWTTSEGATGHTLVPLKVARANVSVAAYDFGTVGHPDDGGISPGQAGDIYLTIENVGTENISGGLLHVTGGGCATSVQGDVAINALAPGQKVRLAQPVSVAVDAACGNGAPASLTLSGTYQSVAANPALQAATNFRVGVMRSESVAAAALGLAIPDNAPGVEKLLAFAKDGVISQVGVHVILTHSYIGDLQVELVHPDGTRVTLHNKEGGATNNLDQTYGLGGQDLPALAALAGKTAKGDWKIVVTDTASSDTGTFDSVELVVKGYLN